MCINTHLHTHTHMRTLVLVQYLYYYCQNWLYMYVALNHEVSQQTATRLVALLAAETSASSFQLHGSLSTHLLTC